jgi:hypothetical protein
MNDTTFKNPVDLAALRSSAKALEDEILEIKGELRSPWTKPMDGAQARLLQLKFEVTTHYVLRALLRSRAHLKRVPNARASERDQAITTAWWKRTLERHLEGAERLASKFRREPRPEEAAAAELERRTPPSLVRRLWTRVLEVTHAVG